MDRPRIVIAGTHSGVGKTSTTLAIVAALKRRGLTVQTFKVGPDFLDPSYLTLASERPCYNLDGWMAGKDYVCRLFARASEDADISVIEGVMGLFDGANATNSEGSTAEIACWLNAPVLLIADAYGTARGLAPVVKGHADFEADVHVTGVIANRCGSKQHVEWLSESLAAASLPPLIGAILVDGFPHLPSRHLGLVTADKGNLSSTVLDGLADAFEEYASVDDLLKLARSAPPIHTSAIVNYNIPAPAEKNGVSIGVAYDEAFHFYYQDLFDELMKRGCRVTFFSPIADTRLPEGLDALYLGGGYPEVYGAALSANTGMLSAIQELASSGRVIYAECGGLMYLCRALETREGVQYPMVGLIPASTRMLDRLKSLAYVEATLNDDSLWGARGTTLRGHEFHFSELIDDQTENTEWKTIYTLKKRRSEATTPEGFQKGRVLASYTHLHLASHPEALTYFIDQCRTNQMTLQNNRHESSGKPPGT